MSDMIKTIGILDHGPGQLHSEKSHTCDRCLAAWSKVPFDEKSADICEIGEKAEELLSSACQVCQMLGMEMLAHQNQTHSLEGPFLLRWQRENQDFGAAVLQDSNGIIRGKSRQPRTIHIRYSEFSESLEADGLEEHETPEGLHVDFGTIRSWLDKCDSHHQCKSDIDEEPQNLKVIDCVERVVVSAPLDCQYVALSYVWGGLVVETDLKSGLLPTMLPRTIEDSIKATLLIGYRYLWVDAFQVDAEDKHCQIQQMDLIYTSAVLTLVAAAGSNPSYGLSGVSNARRVSYRATYIGDVRVFFAPDEVYRAVADSVWFTRGWTFQEGYVPRRRLYFTESGVLFICNEAEEQEDFHRCRHPWGAQLLDGTLGTRPFRVSDELSGLHETLGLLEQYMERQLSYENDALDAMLGVLNYHHARNPSIGTICGLPYQTSVAGPNTICLNWRHDKPATRRRGYPSWSPLGWIGSIQFFSPNHQFFPSKKDADILSHHFRDGCAAWNNFKTSKYLQIAVNVHNLPIVNLVRSDSETFEGMLSDHPRTVLVVPAGTGESKVDYGGLNYYMDVKWDATPPDHYDSTCVTCVVYHSHKDVQCLMIVQDCGTHYERLGFASSVGAFSTDTLKAAGFDELASTTNGLPTLRPRKSPNFYREHSHDSKDFDWLQDTEKVTITLG